jgi:hypothetical protein
MATETTEKPITLGRLLSYVAITVLNVLLGWTFIGWVVALVWASTMDVEKSRRGRGSSVPLATARRALD